MLKEKKKLISGSGFEHKFLVLRSTVPSIGILSQSGDQGYNLSLGWSQYDMLSHAPNT